MLTLSSHIIAYNLMNMPSSLSANSRSVTLDYDAYGMRRHTTYYQGQSLDREKTRVSDLFELEGDKDSNRRLDYIYADGRVVAVRVLENGIGSMYYVLTDHLGSWERVLDGSRNTVQATHFDPWGNRMGFTAWDTPQTVAYFTFDRGFTGHEHYDDFGVINANARIYDPVIGRFFSPDPFVQAPDFTQSFNRYSYCMNNPVMYSDPDGEFFVLDSWIVGFLQGFFGNNENSFSNGCSKGNQLAANDAKIWCGLFQTDSNKSFLGQTWEFVSRLTWQAPQTIVGFGFSQISNLAGQIDNVDYYGGATVCSGNFFGSGAAVTLGSYINGSTSLSADPNNTFFQHEYGHFLQSQEMGIAYLNRVGLPSLLSTHNHDYHPVELDANMRAFLYFNKYLDGFYKAVGEMDKDYGWNFKFNPLTNNIDVVQYIDYKDNNSILLISSLAIRAEWFDYSCWLFPLGPVLTGIFNALYYNSQY